MASNLTSSGDKVAQEHAKRILANLFSTLGLRNRALGIVCLLFCLFVLNQWDSKKQFQPEQVLAALYANHEALELKDWRVRLVHCQRGAKCEGDDLYSDHKDIPAVKELSDLVRTLSPTPNGAVIKYTFTRSELDWIGKHPVVGLVFPRSVQTSAQLLNSGQVSGGNGTNLSFLLNSKELMQTGTVEVSFEFEGLPFFGPMELSPQLVIPEQIGLVQGLSARMEALSGIHRQLALGVAFCLGVLTLFLDTSVVFYFLGFAAASYALRVFLWSQVGLGRIESELTADLISGAINGCYSLSLVLSAKAFADSKPSKNFSNPLKIYFSFWVVAAVLASALANSQIKLYLEEFYDAVACLVCFVVVVLAMLKKDVNHVPEARIFGLTDSSRRGLLFLLSCIFAAGFYVNGMDVLRVFQGQTKEIGHWIHSLFFPVLLCFGLLETGVVSKQLDGVKVELKQKLRLESELEEGRAYQLTMLPSLKGNTPQFQWRAFYKAASRLAGDWIGVREVTFSGGQKLLLTVIVDVTGHGTAAALSTAVVSSHFEIWCQEMCDLLPPTDHDSRQDLLSQLMGRLDKGIASGQNSKSASAVAMLVDSEKEELSLCNCGHPNIFKFTGQTFKVLTTTANILLGNPMNCQGFASSAWAFQKGDIICLYSDGLFTLESRLTMGAFLKKRATNSQNISISHAILMKMRETRAFYRENRANEDDISLVFVNLNK